MEVLSTYSRDDGWELLGPDEVINQWEDFVDQYRLALYVEPVFSKQEREALLTFHQLWRQYCDSTPKFMPAFEEVRKTPEWKNLKHQASNLLKIFEQRGKLDEEIEIT